MQSMWLVHECLASSYFLAIIYIMTYMCKLKPITHNIYIMQHCNPLFISWKLCIS